MPKSKDNITKQQSDTFKSIEEIDAILESHPDETNIIKEKLSKEKEDFLINGNATRKIDVKINLSTGEWVDKCYNYKRLNMKSQKDIETARNAVLDLQRSLRVKAVKDPKVLETYLQKVGHADYEFRKKFVTTITDMPVEDYEYADLEDIKRLEELYEYIKENPYPKYQKA